jgi:hypothetical protein
MPDIQLNDAEMTRLSGNMVGLATKIAEVSSNAYVVGNLFRESRAPSVGVMNEAAQNLAACAESMETLAWKLKQYLDRIVAEFEHQDITLANHANLGDGSTPWR